MQDFKDFFSAIHYLETVPEHYYEPLQWGAQIKYPKNGKFDDIESADIIILGCGEQRGDLQANDVYSNAPNEIRAKFYQLYNWHKHINIFDAGNILQGNTIEDTRAALKIVLSELYATGKKVIIIGGSHDLTYEQYQVFKDNKKMINATIVDMLIDLNESETMDASSYLMDMLTMSPNYVEHYNHIAFQSYFVNPVMLETLDKLRFDFYRVGRVKEYIEDMEPVMRSSHMLSFDMNAIKYSDAPMNKVGSPNGLAGDEACVLAKYAGMSDQLQYFGIYGYDETKDVQHMTATLIAQMLWYYIDGYYLQQHEASLTDKQEFQEFHVTLLDYDPIIFIKSKRTNRWWMQLPNLKWEPCSYRDYLNASKNELPERWLRVQERG
jgi:formiminoglutamase